MGKSKKKKKQQGGGGGSTGGAAGGGPATALQVEAVVVGGHCCELYPSLILRVGPESQVLFHAGAGLQRYCGEHHVRLARTSHILLSEMTSASTAGLDGVLLTLADIGQPKLLVVGPAGTRGCVEAASAAGFIHRPEFALETLDVLDGSEAWAPPPGIEITAVVARTTGEAQAEERGEPPAKRAATGAGPPPPGVASEPPSQLPPAAAADNTPVQLYVGNLAYSVDDAALRGPFDRFGGALSCRVILDRQSGTSRGFGFVTLPNTRAAHAAIELGGMGLLTLAGRPMRVDLAERGGGRAADGGWAVRGDEPLLPGLAPPTGSVLSYICKLPTSRGAPPHHPLALTQPLSRPRTNHPGCGRCAARCLGPHYLISSTSGFNTTAPAP